GAGRTGSVGGVGLRGPGETQLETDRREIQKRITKLEDELEKVRERRARHRSQRKKSNVPIVALVGYTNAGKSTLLNAITNSDIYVADQLFATLDPTIRQLQLPGGTEILVSDTVGFIQKLPTQLVAAFRATLEEIKEADLLLHIVDASHEHHQEQSYSVLETLREIEAGDIPVLTVYNKIDLLDEETLCELETMNGEMSFFISARTGEGVETLQEAIADELFKERSLLKVLLPYSEGRLVSLFHERGNVINVEHLEEGILIYGRLPREIRPYFKDYLQ
nr:GTPase HflX [Anaerolineaceae bacterium]